MVEIFLKQESYDIVGACFDVYNEMGCGFLEAVYQECLEYEFLDRQIPSLAHEKLKINFKQRELKCHYTPDFICFGKIIVEIKSLRELTNEHRAQVHNYLKATGHKLGLLVNFGCSTKLEYERIVR